MVYIVPYYRLTEDICRVFCDNFEDVSIHRFMDGEFKKFKQVAVMGLRRQRTDNETEAEFASGKYTLKAGGRFQLPRQFVLIELGAAEVFHFQSRCRKCVQHVGRTPLGGRASDLHRIPGHHL